MICSMMIQIRPQSNALLYNEGQYLAGNVIVFPMLLGSPLYCRWMCCVSISLRRYIGSSLIRIRGSNANNLDGRWWRTGHTADRDVVHQWQPFRRRCTGCCRRWRRHSFPSRRLQSSTISGPSSLIESNMLPLISPDFTGLVWVTMGWTGQDWIRLDSTGLHRTKQLLLWILLDMIMFWWASK